MIKYLKEEEYKKISPVSWYGYPRGWTNGVDIYVNEDAFFIDSRDRILLIEHEQGHIDGKEHTTFGLMSPYGLVRWLTTLQ